MCVQLQMRGYHRRRLPSSYLLSFLSGPGGFHAVVIRAGQEKGVPTKPLSKKPRSFIKTVFQADYVGPDDGHARSGEQTLPASNGNERRSSRTLVLCAKAGNLNARAGDYVASFKAIDELDKPYTINTPQMKAAAVDAAVKTGNPSINLEGVVRTAFGLIEQALVKEDYDTAQRLVRCSRRASARES